MLFRDKEVSRRCKGGKSYKELRLENGKGGVSGHWGAVFTMSPAELLHSVIVT